MFLILSMLIVTAYAHAFDMTRTNRSVVVHRHFHPLTVGFKRPSADLLSMTKSPQLYPSSNTTDVKVYNTTNTTPTVQSAPAPAPAPLPRSLRH